MLVPVAASSLYSTVTSSAASFSAMTGKRYVFSSNTACFIKQGPAAGSPTASSAAGSMYVPSDSFITIDPKYGDTVSVIRDSADGKATLQEVAEVG